MQNDAIYKMAISKFQNFEFLTPKIKKTIFLGKLIKSKIKKNEKTEYMSQNLMTTTYMPNLKQIHQYLVPNRPKTFQNYAYQNFQLHFLEVLDN